MDPRTIPSNNKLRLQTNATLTAFALLTSAMHIARTRYIGGRLKCDYQYSVGVNYSTFPLPPADSGLSRLERLMQAVLVARAECCADRLYDSDLMPPNPRRAHQVLDRTVDWLHRRSGFASDRKRVQHSVHVL